MSKKKSLSRFGDTSFRIKYQLKFHLELLNIIYENNADGISLDELWKKVNNNIVYYDDNSKVDRENLVAKQLKGFQLVTISKERIVHLTKLGKSFIDIIEQDSQKYNFDFVATIWFYLMINSEQKLSKNFRGLVNTIISIKNEIKEDYIISFIVSKNCYEKDLKIEMKKCTQEQLEEIVKNGSIQSVFKLRKKLCINNSLPDLIKNLSDEQLVNKILDSDKKLLSKLKQSCKLFYSKKVNLPILKKYIYKRNINLIIDLVNLAHYRTIKKDYLDINLRWFIESKLLKIKDSKLYINENYCDLYKKLLNVEFDDYLSNFKNFISNYNLETKSNKLPYTKEEIIDMLEMLNFDKWYELKQKYGLDNVSNATIFEYLINMIFFTSYNYDVSNIKLYCRTILDDDLKPYSHAPAGNPDGLVKINNQLATIESTIIDNLESLLKNEKQSIQRHSVKSFDKVVKEIGIWSPYFEEKKLSNDDKIVFFVLLKGIDKKIVYNFSSNRNYEYFDDPSIKIKTIALSSIDLIKIYKENKIRNLEKIINDFPIKIEMNINFENLLEHYTLLINKTLN